MLIRSGKSIMKENYLEIYVKLSKFKPKEFRIGIFEGLYSFYNHIYTIVKVYEF